MNVDQIMPAALSPFNLAGCLAIGVGAWIAYALLRDRWKQRSLEESIHTKELAALALAVFAALLFVFALSLYIGQREAEAAMRVEVRERTALAGQVGKQIASELEFVRELLVSRTQSKIAEGKLAEARTELARFLPLQDPQVVKIVALIDKELEIRKLLEQSLLETAPEKLSPIFSRLTELAPDRADYREQAARYAAQAKPSAPARTAP